MIRHVLIGVVYRLIFRPSVNAAHAFLSQKLLENENWAPLDSHMLKLIEHNDTNVATDYVFSYLILSLIRWLTSPIEISSHWKQGPQGEDGKP